MPASNGSNFSPKLITQHLDEMGDGSGNFDANGDYSITPKKFFLKPTSTSSHIIHTLIVHVSDAGLFSPNEYGNLGAVLTNGLDFRIIRSGEDYSLLKYVIKDNDGFLHAGINVALIPWGSALDNSLAATIDFKGMFGMPLYLNGAEGDEISITLNDNFSGLTDHHFITMGYI